MSDQFTRITKGGSPLPATQQAVVGLLFGTPPPPPLLSSSSQQPSRRITDAEDVPILWPECSEQATTQVRLHNTVFPQHVVVGWYRVVHSESNNSSSNNSNNDAPTPEDLVHSLQLQKQFGTRPDDSTSSSSSSSETPFLFALLQVQEQEPNNNNDEDDETDTELPLQLFAVDATRQVLVAVEEWKLETAMAERIAVERVMKEPQQFSNNINNDNSTSSMVMFELGTTPVQHSLRALQQRWGLVQDYLEAAARGTVPTDLAMLRQIQGLLLSVGPLGASATVNEPDDGLLLLQQLSLLTKTVSTLQQCNDKLRLVHDAPNAIATSSSTGGERMVRGMPVASSVFSSK